jgi:hypothetical protein
MLAQAIYQLNSPSSLNFTFGYFFIHNVFIRGCFELCNVDFEEFSLRSLHTCVIILFCQGISKN